MDLISVIVPAYNVEDYLKRCLDSLLAQTYTDTEIIIVDDGSTDNTPKMLDEYSSADDRIRVVHKENGGVSSARNTALDMVRGSYVAFPDADDYCEPDMLKSLYDAITQAGADMAVCGYYEEYKDRTDEYGIGLEQCVYDQEEAFAEYFTMGGRIGSGCWNKLVKREALEGIRYKPYEIGEDVEFITRVLGNCKKVVLTGYGGYHYIHREDSATQLVFRPANFHIINAVDDMLGFIRDGYPALTQRMYAYHAAWVSATVQVLHRPENISGHKKERAFLRDVIRRNKEGYSNNPYIPRLDVLVLKSFSVGCYRPVKGAYDLAARLKHGWR